MTRPYEPPKSLAELGISDRRAAMMSDEQLRGLAEEAKRRDRQRHAEQLLIEQEAAQAEIRAAAARKAATPSRSTPRPSKAAQTPATPRRDPVAAKPDVRVDLTPKPRKAPTLAEDLRDAAAYLDKHPEAARPARGGVTPPWRTSI